MDSKTLLLKAIQAEKRLGCNNGAVFGGFDRFVIQQLEKLAGKPGGGGRAETADFIRLFADYGQVSRSKREEKLEKLWHWLVNLPVSRPAPRRAQSQPQLETQLEAKEKTEAPPARTAEKSQGLPAQLQYVKNIGPKRATALQAMGINTLRDLLFHLPRDYQDRSQFKHPSQLVHGEKETVLGTVVNVQELRPRRGLVILKALLRVEESQVYAVWFNQRYLKEQLKAGTELVVAGKTDRAYGIPQINVEEFEIVDRQDLIHTGRIVPVYPGSGQLNSRFFRTVIYRLLDQVDEIAPEFLPGQYCQQHSLLPRPQALQEIHFPQSWTSRELARRRLAFDELFLLQLALALLKGTEKTAPKGIAHSPVPLPLEIEFRQRLPFQLTRAQERVLGEIYRDMAAPRPMTRLVQGDVGSGKTIVAALALLKTVASGFQGALMAPTEILAEQHYWNLQELFRPLGLPVGLLTSSKSKKERRQLLADLASGHLAIVIGTHALLQEDVVFARLGLAVVDEQHRFGVRQRALLREKGNHPDLLVMTATPIPRTLALTLYGDLDVSVIDELPPGRKPVKTHWLNRSRLDKLYAFIREQLEQGRQAYVVCPLVEESEKMDLEAATKLAQEWQEQIFPQFRVGLLHGRMRQEEKEGVMEEFRQNRLQILVSTTVIEVGVNVPNATIMVVIDAERFGLAQLHQLRGRVGRGEYQSYCFLISDTQSAEGRARLRIMEQTNDGFVLAEEDLKLRGPGEFFGTRQSGLPELKVADLVKDLPLLEGARQLAFRIVEEDPKLARPEHRLLKEELKATFADGLDLAQIG